MPECPLLTQSGHLANQAIPQDPHTTNIASPHSSVQTGLQSRSYHEPCGMAGSHGASLPNAPALLSGKNVVADYAEFARRVASLASALQARLGIGPGDRVAIVMSNCVEYLELLYATWFAGAAVVPINFKLHAKEAAWIIENAEAKAVFVSESAAAELTPLIERLPGLCCRPLR